MNLSINQENLSKALNIVSRIASTKTSLPILNNILIRAENNYLTLSTTNLELSIINTIPAKIKENGVITIPAKILTDFIHQLPKTDVNLELSNNKLKIKAGNYKSIINTTPPDEFPILPKLKEDIKLIIKSDLFKEVATQTIIVAGNDTTRPILTGVYLHTFDKNLYITATDGYRLAERKITTQEGEISAIIPSTTIQEVLRVITDEVNDIEIKINDEQISFQIENIIITSRLIDGKFINYRELIPKKAENSAILDKNEFLRVVKISELFARESAGSIIIKTNLKKQLLKINSITSEIGENSAEIEGEITGDEGVITLNSKYLIDALNVINSDKIKFNFSGKLSPSLLTAADNLNYKHIIMPVKS